MKPKLYLTRLLPEKGMQRLLEYFDVEAHQADRVATKQEILAGINGKDALLCLLTDTIDKEIIEAEPSIKVISNYAVGYNNIDVATATAKGIPVCNTPGVLTEATADLAWALIMSVSRRIVEGDNMLRAGKFHGWAPQMLLGMELSGKTLGIVGMGRIGLATAFRSIGFGMNVVYSDSKDAELKDGLKAKRVEFSELLETADIVSIHVPLSDSTHHLFGAAEFKRMKKTALLINTARGPIVDEAALAEALKNGEIGGAGLDVYEEEPAVHPNLIGLSNAVLIPHLGSATIETRTKMALMAAQNAIAIFENEQPESIVNPEVLKK